MTSRIATIGGTDIGTADELLALLRTPTGPTAWPDLFELMATPIDLGDYFKSELTKT